MSFWRWVKVGFAIALGFALATVVLAGVGWFVWELGVAMQKEGMPGISHRR